MTLQELLEKQEKEYRDKLNWKDCGKFTPGEDVTVRDCLFCGERIQFCVACGHDHHIDNKDDVTVRFLRSTSTEAYNEGLRAARGILEWRRKPTDGTTIYATPDDGFNAALDAFDDAIDQALKSQEK